MKASDILAYVRDNLDDAVQPYHWKDDELARYLNDAQDEAARRSHCLVYYPSLVLISGNADISFNASAKTITKSSGGFLSAGTGDYSSRLDHLSNEELIAWGIHATGGDASAGAGGSECNTFELDDSILISGTSYNNGTFTIANITDTAITVLETLTDENSTSAVIEDVRSVTRIPLLSGVHTYKLHPQTLMVIRARVDSLSYPLRQKTMSGLDSDITVVDYDLGSANYELDSMWYYDSWETLQGNVWAFIEQNGFVRIISPPQFNDILWLVVARLPKLRFIGTNLGLEPEIPSQYHADLADWIMHRAYLKNDTETQDMAKAKWYESSFEKKFGPRPSAQTEMNRKRFPPNQRMRARQFGMGG